MRQCCSGSGRGLLLGCAVRLRLLPVFRLFYFFPHSSKYCKHVWLWNITCCYFIKTLVENKKQLVVVFLVYFLTFSRSFFLVFRNMWCQNLPFWFFQKTFVCVKKSVSSFCGCMENVFRKNMQEFFDFVKIRNKLTLLHFSYFLRKKNSLWIFIIWKISNCYRLL